MHSRTVQIKMNVPHRQKIPKQIVFESDGQTFVFNLLNTMKAQTEGRGNSRPVRQVPSRPQNAPRQDPSSRMPFKPKPVPRHYPDVTGYYDYYGVGDFCQKITIQSG